MADFTYGPENASNLEQLEEWYTVFSAEDTHPVTGESMSGMYVTMHCINRETARRESCRRFGDQWTALILGQDIVDREYRLAPDRLCIGAFGDQALEFERMFGSTYNGRLTGETPITT